MGDIVVKEFQQLTLDDWMDIKSELEQEFRNAAAGFVRIGYLLRKAKESEGYKNDGYNTLAEWAKEEYNLSSTQVSRFMEINEKYSIGGYSKQLLPEFANYGQSKLTEMLTLSDEGMEMVTPDMKREDIRKIKAFERQAPSEEPVQEWIKAFIDANAGLAWLENTKAYREKNLQGMIEEINPTGTKTFRAGRTMVSMMKDRIMVRVFPDPAERMEWSEFFEEIRKEFDRRKREMKEAIAREEERRAAEEAEQAQQEHISVESEHFDGENEQISAETDISEQEPDKKPVTALEEYKESVTEEPPADVIQEEAPPAAGAEEPEKPVEEIAPAQKESPPSIVTNNAKTDSAIAEEPEQVEIDEILPAPTEPNRMRDLKDHFEEVLGTLKMMLDMGNYKSMDIPIDRLKALRAKLIEESIKEGEG